MSIYIVIKRILGELLQRLIFCYAKRSDLDASHKREEIETDLIGAYYLEVGEAPLARFGHTENIPP
jgi:hypothetical protein